MKFFRLSLILFCLLNLLACNTPTPGGLGTVVTTPTNPSDLKAIQFTSNHSTANAISGSIPNIWDVIEYNPGDPLGPEVLPDLDPNNTVATFVRNNLDRFTMNYAVLEPNQTFEDFMRLRRPNEDPIISADDEYSPNPDILFGSYAQLLPGGPKGGKLVDVYSYSISARDVVFIRGEVFGDNAQIDLVLNDLANILNSVGF